MKNQNLIFKHNKKDKTGVRVVKGNESLIKDMSKHVDVSIAEELKVQNSKTKCTKITFEKVSNKSKCLI